MDQIIVLQDGRISEVCLFVCLFFYTFQVLVIVYVTNLEPRKHYVLSNYLTKVTERCTNMAVNVTQVGTYTELIKNRGAFAEFLKTYATEEQTKLEYGGLHNVIAIA